MGIWGTGIYDCDGAWDSVDDLVKRLGGEIKDLYADDDDDMEIEDLDSVVLPYVHVIAVLCEHCKATPPKVALVTSWRDRYLKLFADTVDETDAKDDYKVGRPVVIAETFEKLLIQSREFEKHLG